MTEVCKTQGCNKPTKTRGLCNRCDQRRWRAKNPQRSKDIQREWRQRNSENASVRDHHYYIFRKRIPSYLGMPFYAAWNPDCGGSFKAGSEWIIGNIGRRPDPNHQLHIIDRRIGFMPWNLVWVPKDMHRQEEMLNRVLRENQNLRLEIESLRVAR